tara:strand:- start:909 stop:1649 length:741 start_codon:yes stop_codon:yes gene_type:complete
MPGTHSVGSLFVNISGSTKGLKKALGSAKKQIGQFSQTSGGGIFGMSRVAQAQQAVARAGHRRAALETYASRGPSRLKGSRQQFSGEMKRVLNEQGAAKTELTAATAAKNMRVGLGVFGVTIGAVAALFRKGNQLGQASIQQHQKFGALGKEGPRFIQASIGQVMKELAFAQTPEGSELAAKAKEREVRMEDVARKWAPMADKLAEFMVVVMEWLAPQSKTTFAQSQADMHDRAARNVNGGRWGVG